MRFYKIEPIHIFSKSQIRNLLPLWVVYLFFCFALNDINSIAASVQDSISISSELRKLNEIGDLPKYESDARSYQISSYDTTGGNEDGFNGKYSFLRRNPDGSLVIFDVVGAGVINRFWTPTPTDDTLDFYIDNPNKITFSIKYLDLFSGKCYPFVSPLCDNQLGGYFCYFPIPFQKSCKIVYRGKKLQFHQIQYKLFTDSKKVKSFSPDLNYHEKLVLEKVKEKWNLIQKDILNYYTKNEFLTASNSVLLKPGNSLTIFERNKGGRILGIEFKPANTFEGLEKQIDIKITWDNENRPAIYIPVHDFFGYAFGSQSMQCLLLGTQNNKDYCYFPMPFDKGVKVELVYRKNDQNQTPVNVDYTFYYSEHPRNMETEGKFYAAWNRSIDPEKGKPYYFLERKGKGHYVGTILQAQGLQPGMTFFFEGDDSISVDGESIIHGTGSEDYFNGGWYAFMDRWDAKISLPIHGALDYSLPLCRTGGYRFYLTDKIPFNKNITFTIEHGPAGNEIPVDYTSVALYYCDIPDSKHQQQPTNNLTTVYIPDTLIIFPQLMTYNVWDKVAFDASWSYNTGGMSFTYTVNDESRLRISLKDIPHNKYKLFLDFTKFDEGCEFSIWQRQTQISSWFRTDHISPVRVEKLFICDIDIQDFKDALTIRFKTDEKHKKLFINRMILIKAE